MSNCVHQQDLHGCLDRKHLQECLEDALRQLYASSEEIVFSFGNVEVHVDYPNNELYVVV
jgi:hypothetical protein